MQKMKERFMVENVSKHTMKKNSSLILAGNRTHRRDPLDNFRHYKEGWNISNKHYWASVGFTAVPYFGIAIAWFALFGITLCGLLICRYWKKRVNITLHPYAYAILLVLLIIFSGSGIAGSIMLCNEQVHFHRSITHTMDFLVGVSESTVQTLRNVTDVISLALVNELDLLFVLEGQQQRVVDSLNRKLKHAAKTLESKTNDNHDKIKRVLNAVHLALVCLAAVMLTLAFAGLVSSLRGLRRVVYSLVLISWLLVTATFILSGVFLLLSNAIADTCVSMEQWVAHPHAHTSLDDILPCVDADTAEQSLIQSKQITNAVVDVINALVDFVFNSNRAGTGITGYNQSGPSMPFLCNPYTSELEDRNCTAGEVSLEDASKVWKSYSCSVASSGNCITIGRMTPAIYDEVVVAVQMIYGLYKYAPFLIDLKDCTFVRIVFTNITTDYCPDLRKELQWMNVGLTSVGTAILLSIVLWIIYSRQRSHMENYYRTHPSRRWIQFIVGRLDRAA